MNRDEILKAAQKNVPKDGMGEYEKSESRRNMLHASAAAVALCCIMIIIEMIVKHTIDLGKPAIILIIECVMNFRDAKTIGSRKKYIQGIIEAVVTAFILMLYVGAMFI